MPRTHIDRRGEAKPGGTDLVEWDAADLTR
jgi:hypothetical protein